jgi:3-hydroxybutyryl-CoA dehydratase
MTSAVNDERLTQCLEVTDSMPSRSLAIDDLAVGLAVQEKFVFDAERLLHFRKLANDRAPIHSDPSFARAGGFDEPIIQGLALSTRFSRLIGMYLPGERAILERIELKYRAPVFAGQQLIYRCELTRILRALKVVQLALAISVNGEDRVTGQCQCLVR